MVFYGSSHSKKMHCFKLDTSGGLSLKKFVLKYLVKYWCLFFYRHGSTFFWFVNTFEKHWVFIWTYVSKTIILSSVDFMGSLNHYIWLFCTWKILCVTCEWTHGRYKLSWPMNIFLSDLYFKSAGFAVILIGPSSVSWLFFFFGNSWPGFLIYCCKQS